MYFYALNLKTLKDKQIPINFVTLPKNDKNTTVIDGSGVYSWSAFTDDVKK